MYTKKNFQVDEAVVIRRTTDVCLDEHKGIILGKSADLPITDFYIVLLDVPHKRGDKAVNLTEACIDRD